MSRFGLLSDSFHYFRRSEKNMLLKIRKALGFKPYLDYIEFHLADHCNLNCKGCGHFAPLADQEFPDLERYKNDLSQLKKLFSKINKIVLLGGEPLLNPQIGEFLFATKWFFPSANIQVFTNGILLPQMPQSFWDACRACLVTIDITIYPPLILKESSLIDIVKTNGLKVRTHRVTHFHAFYNRKGDTEAKRTFLKCRSRWYTPMLKDGKIYVCPKAATIHCFSRKFSLDISEAGFVDIYSSSSTGWAVKDQIDKSWSLCNYCTLGWDVIPIFPWAPSKRILPDWSLL